MTYIDIDIDKLIHVIHLYYLKFWCENAWEK
jgi:hypothetical protein